jgi:transposase-like protein
VFQDTRKPLRTWFLAMWFITSQKNGVSALGLQRVLGLGSYETAWTWMHKLRRAMVRPDRDRLTGDVEVDETYVGGPEEGKRGREIDKKSIVMVAAEKNGRAIGRIRLKRVKDVSAESLLGFIRETVQPGATIHTDGWPSYAGLPAAGYKHCVTVISGGQEQAHKVMPRVHNVASLLKRWLLGTLQGGVQQQHLDYYLVPERKPLFFNNFHDCLFGNKEKFLNFMLSSAHFSMLRDADAYFTTCAGERLP